MQRLLLPLFLLIVLCGLGAGIWWLSSRAPEASPPSAASAAAPATPTSDAATALDESGAPKSADARSAALPELPPGAVVLRGELRLPAGIQDPGPVVVYDLSERASYRDLARLLEREPKADEKPEPDELRIVAQCQAGANGAFELSLPEGSRRAYLLVQGRFLYLEHTREIDLRRQQRVTLVPRAGACLVGTVKLPEGASLTTLEDLRVELGPVIRGAMAMRPDAPGKRKVKTPGGAFELRAVACDSGYRLTIQSDAYALVEREVEQLRAGETRAFELVLEPGGTLRGVVRDPEGQPREGAEVAGAHAGDWFGVDDREVRSAKSGPDGAFELAHVPAGKLELRARLSGFLPSEKKEIELPGGGVTEGVALELRAGQALAGTVTFVDGKPAGGAEVKVGFDLSQAAGLGGLNALEGADGSATADAEGRFRVGGLGKGPFTVRASALPPGASVPEGTKKEDAQLHARADGVTPGTQALVLVLRDAEALHGRVVDAAQKPVAKFKVKVQHEGKGLLAGLGQDSQERAIDDAEGKFRVGGLSAGTWKLWVSAEDCATSDPQSLTLPQTSDAPELVITLQPSCTVSGRVVSAQGQPVGAAHVTNDGSGPAWQKALSGAPPEPQADSDADGTFRLEGLKPGHADLVASAPEHARSLPQPLELVAGVEQKDVVLTLREGGSISGEVYDEQGKPLAGMFVQGTLVARYDVHFENSDGEGRFQFEHLEPGTYQVVAFAAKALGAAGADQNSFMSNMKMASAEVQDGQDTHVILGAPPADPVLVVGRVTHAGEPYTDALVSFIHEGKDVLTRMKNVSVDKQGAFEVRLNESGRYSISVQRLRTGGMGQQNTVEFVREIPKEKRFELVLEMPTGRISGKVLDPEGNPAKGERVTLHPHSALIGGSMWGGMYVEAQTDGDGFYDLDALRPGAYVLSVGGMAMGGIFGSDAAHGREVRSDIKVSEGDWLRDIDFRLRKPGKVDVLVVGEDDKPIPKAAIFARDAGGNLLDRLSMISTDDNGIAHYGGLAPGEYSFSSRMDVRASSEGARVKIGEGESQQVKLVLQGASLLLVQVVDSAGQNVQAALSVLDAQGHEAGGMYGMNEIMDLFAKNGLDFTTTRVGPLPPGKYTVSAHTADGKAGTKPVTLSGQPERKLTIRVE